MTWLPPTYSDAACSLTHSLSLSLSLISQSRCSLSVLSCQTAAAVYPRILLVLHTLQSLLVPASPPPHPLAGARRVWGAPWDPLAATLPTSSTYIHTCTWYVVRCTFVRGFSSGATHTHTHCFPTRSKIVTTCSKYLVPLHRRPLI
ncbi:hypothetical protein LX32DRAFT_350479 [Colletotrichum zoysiae]|uniref:Uncharacterized protein n=1 Tax=Colletotrichum zoysiae TaxID=1216348 RepID=A0AAD9M5U8_9PEZI|nr:hypothetical protein LX32DRAFT_350479 [Colletotrichum zoysiae]